MDGELPSFVHFSTTLTTSDNSEWHILLDKCSAPSSYPLLPITPNNSILLEMQGISVFLSVSVCPLIILTIVHPSDFTLGG